MTRRRKGRPTFAACSRCHSGNVILSSCFVCSTAISLPTHKSHPSTIAFSTYIITNRSNNTPPTPTISLIHHPTALWRVILRINKVERRCESPCSRISKGIRPSRDASKIVGGIVVKDRLEDGGCLGRDEGGCDERDGCVTQCAPCLCLLDSS